MLQIFFAYFNIGKNFSDILILDFLFFGYFNIENFCSKEISYFNIGFFYFLDILILKKNMWIFPYILISKIFVLKKKFSDILILKKISSIF